MRADKVSRLEHAYAYIVDCLLATVDELAMKRKKGKREYLRHIAIAQRAVNWMNDFGIPCEGTRAQDVNKVGNVLEYANNISRTFGVPEIKA